MSLDPLASVASRRGHFRMESGLHGDLWLDLDRLFAVRARWRPRSMRGHDALKALDLAPVVVAALAVLGTRGSDFFAGVGVPVETLSRRSYDAWAPADCPQCRAGIVLERVG